MLHTTTRLQVGIRSADRLWKSELTSLPATTHSYGTYPTAGTTSLSYSNYGSNSGYHSPQQRNGAEEAAQTPNSNAYYDPIRDTTRPN
jgi:hypothetical protein